MNQNRTAATPALHRFLKPIASLQLTVALFAMGMVLVFFGTLAQMEQGIWGVVDKYFRSFIVMIDFNLFVKFGQTFFGFDQDMKWSGAFPFPGGWLIGFVMLANLLAAHFIRFRMTWKRSGIFLIHSGFIILMLSELITGIFSVEANMTLRIGETSNFVDVTREMRRSPTEIAIIDPSDAKEDDVTAVPTDLLTKGKRLVVPNLPVDLLLIESHKNTTLVFDPNPGPDSLQTVDGEYYRMAPTREEAGVKSSKDNAPLFLVSVLKKNTDEVLGTFKLSLWQYGNFFQRRILSQPMTFEAEGKTYRIEMRYKRVYKPYSIHLLNFEHKKYEGTSTPKDFASTVRLVDPDSGDDREVRIWMNHPLRHRGETFYQSSFLSDDNGTVLQVVKNPVWTWPYIACVIVSFGLLIHFGMALITYLQKTGTFAGEQVVATAANRAQLLHVLTKASDHGGTQASHDFKPKWLTVLEILFPVFVVVATAGYLAYKWIPRSPKEGQVDFASIGSLQILDHGRIKPMDTLARASLLSISGRQEVTDDDGNHTSAIEWFVDTFDNTELYGGRSAKYPVFRIDSEEVLDFFDLKPKPGFYRYSIFDLGLKLDDFTTEAARIAKKPEASRSLRENKFMDLAKRLDIYQRIVRLNFHDMQRMLAAGELPRVVPPQAEGEKWKAFIEIDEQAKSKFAESEWEEVGERQMVKLLQDQLRLPRKKQTLDQLLAESEDARAAYKQFLRAPFVQKIIAQATESEILLKRAPKFRGEISPAAGALSNILELARARRGEQCNAALAEYKEKYCEFIPEKAVKASKVESVLNQTTPFYYASVFYVWVIVLGVCSWLGWSRPLVSAAFWLATLTSLIHTAGLLARMYVQDRPPVTNLYSSAVFIGWGALGFCLIMERIFKNGIGVVTGGAVGAATMLVAHHLAEGGDTFDMLQAVLDTNFWLATHVTCVTLGYMATFVVGVIAVLYVLAAVFTPFIDKETSKKFGSMMYGVTCFAMLFSFVGTVLGGIWGDQSWGRFWGWDPKENGAVLIVIWNALILHARWCGLVKERGIAVLAILGAMVTVWSWFGTNQLQVGLHSYGFSKTLVDGCRNTWVVLSILTIIGLLPKKWWGSYSALNPQQFEPRPAPADSAPGGKGPKKPARRNGNR